MVTFRFSSAIRGFHVYRYNWTPVVGEKLGSAREYGNPNDKRAVAITKGNITVGHVPMEISKIVWYFLRKGGRMTCTVRGKHIRSRLAQGGLEVPCSMTFRGEEDLMDKLKVLLSEHTN